MTKIKISLNILLRIIEHNNRIPDHLFFYRLWSDSSSEANYGGHYRIALPATLSHSQPLPATPSHSHHSHTFFKKNNSLPLIFQEKRPTPFHFSTKTTHSYPFFNKNKPLQPNFQEKRTNPTHFLTKTSPSQPFLMKNDPLPPSFNKNNPVPPIFQQIWPTPTYFSTKMTHSHHSHPFFDRSSTKATCIHQFSNYNRLSLSVTINALKLDSH